MIEQRLITAAERLGAFLQARQLQIAVAESCTGGLIAQTLTTIPGCSSWFERGFVTYSNTAKIQMLGVLPQTLECYGAVSAEVALEMVKGVLMHSEADCAVAVTGIAGPGGGSLNKPVGTVFIAWAMTDQDPDCQQIHFEGDRQGIRQQAAEQALRYWDKGNGVG